MLLMLGAPAVLLKTTAKWLYSFDKYILYYALWVVFLIFIINLYRLFKKNYSALPFRQAFKKAITGLVLCAIVTVIATSAVDSKFRALSDETILVSVSQKMYLDQEAVRCNEGELSYGKLECRTYNHEIRNPFFPFLLSITHSILGFDSKNGFILNTIICFFLLWVLYLTAGIFLGQKTAIGSVIFLASFPIFLQNINSSTYEATNVLFTLISFYFLSQLYLKKDGLYLELFMLSAALAASTRYESALVALAGIPVLLSFIRNSASFRVRDWLHYPLYFIPAEIHVLLFIGDDHQAGDIAPFSSQHFWKNLTDNVFMLASWDKLHVMSPLVFYLALLGLLFFLYHLFTGKIKITPIIWAAFLFFLMPFLVIHFYYAGTFTLNINTRISLIFLPFIALFASCFLNRWSKFGYGNILAAAIFLFMLAPANADYVHKSMYLPNERRNIVGYFEQEKRGERPLVFYSRPDFFLLEGMSSLYYKTLLQNQTMLYDYIKDSKYDEYYYIRGLDCRREKVEPGKLLKEIYQKSTCDEVEQKFPLREEKRFYMNKNFLVVISTIDQDEFVSRYEETLQGETKNSN